MALPFNLHDELDKFMQTKGSSADLYNEISLQLELGIYLRNALIGTNFKVQFERNIKDFYPKTQPAVGFVKKEIDIVVFDGADPKNSTERYAIELKFPINGQYPEEMFAFITDMQFMEEVKKHAAFNETYCITLVDDKNFFCKKDKRCSVSGIYKYFRTTGEKIPSEIEKPTGKEKTKPSRTVASAPVITWHTPKTGGDRRYYILKF